MKLFTTVELVACLFGGSILLACGATSDTPTENSADSGTPGYLGCNVQATPTEEPVEDPTDGAFFSFVTVPDGFVGMARGLQNSGYRFSVLDSAGMRLGNVVNVWGDQNGGESPEIAVSGATLALVDVGSENEGRSVCRVGFVDLDTMDARGELVRISDAPDQGTILNEAVDCSVTATENGFFVVWQQYTSAVVDEMTLFGQELDVDGQPAFERLTLAVGDKGVAQIALTSDGNVIYVAFEGDRNVSLVAIEGESVVTHTIEAAVMDVPHLTVTKAGLLARTSNELFLLDFEGRVVFGPLPNQARLVAPLGDGYVTVEQQEFLVARAVDATLEQRSAPSALSEERGAYGDQLLVLDEDRVALFYEENGHQRLATLACADSATPLGPATCPLVDEVTPLDDGCTDPVCHIAVRLDGLTLGLRGYAVIGGDAVPTNTDAALNAAQVAFELGEESTDGIEMSGPQAGLFTAYKYPGDFGGFALVGEDSGLVVAAGGIAWSGRGTYWTPSEWLDDAAIACGPTSFEPGKTFIHEEECGGDGEPLAGADAALSVVLRSNLAAHTAAQGPFSVFAYTYTPTVGDCDPGAVEYLVVLSQVRE
jgi:hypothetical protein